MLSKRLDLQLRVAELPHNFESFQKVSYVILILLYDYIKVYYCSPWSMLGKPQMS